MLQGMDAASFCQAVVMAYGLTRHDYQADYSLWPCRLPRQTIAYGLADYPGLLHLSLVLFQTYFDPKGIFVLLTATMIDGELLPPRM